MNKNFSIAIGIITFRRLKGLRKLLDSLSQQAPSVGYQITILVVNNDLESHAQVQKIIEDIRPQLPFKVELFMEPARGISQARNKVIDAASVYDALIFIDDDEYATPEWLLTLLKTWQNTGADIVTGPVMADMPPEAPSWALCSRTYDDYRIFQTGTVLDKAYTNNTLISGTVIRALQPAFDPAFSLTGSEDIHYFQRALRAGYKIVWCAEAIVYESVPMSRLTWRWLTKRSFRNGAGDAIVRLKLEKTLKNYGYVFLMGCGRLFYGLKFMSIGTIKRDLHRSVRGYRVFISGIGTFSGILGINYNEYKHVHGE